MNSWQRGRDAVQSCCFLPKMRNWSVTGKQKSIVCKYLKVLVKIILSATEREAVIWLVGWGTHIVLCLNWKLQKEHSKKFSSYYCIVIVICQPCIISTTAAVWDWWWPVSKYLWIYSTMVSPPFIPHGERGVVWIGASDIVAATPSLVIWETGEGSEAGYIKQTGGSAVNA